MSGHRCILACLGVLALVGVARADASPPSAAADGPRFGDQGLVISGGSSFQLTSSSYSGAESTGQNTRFALGLDLFIGKRFSIGLDLLVSLQHPAINPGSGAGLVVSGDETLSAAVRGGYVIDLGPHFSLYPRVSFGVHHGGQRWFAPTVESVSLGTAPGSSVSSDTEPWIEGDLLFLLHLSPDLFVGFGPEFSYDFGDWNRGSNLTQLALALELGGVVGSGAVAPSNDSAHERPGFGRAGSMVLTGELTLSGTLRWQAGDGESSQSLSIAPGLDWFVIDNLSLGGALAIDLARWSVNSADERIVRKSSAIGFEPRVGYNLVFNQWLSLYAQAGVLFQRSSYEVEGTEVVLQPTRDSRVTLALGLRLIAQVSKHLFLGLGPSLEHDLSRNYRTDERLKTVNGAATTLGLTSTFGGWFDLH